MEKKASAARKSIVRERSTWHNAFTNRDFDDTHDPGNKSSTDNRQNFHKRNYNTTRQLERKRDRKRDRKRENRASYVCKPLGSSSPPERMDLTNISIIHELSSPAQHGSRHYEPITSRFPVVHFRSWLQNRSRGLCYARRSFDCRSAAAATFPSRNGTRDDCEITSTAVRSTSVSSRSIGMRGAMRRCWKNDERIGAEIDSSAIVTSNALSEREDFVSPDSPSFLHLITSAEYIRHLLTHWSNHISKDTRYTLAIKTSFSLSFFYSTVEHLYHEKLLQ